MVLLFIILVHYKEVYSGLLNIITDIAQSSGELGRILKVYRLLFCGRPQEIFETLGARF